MKRVGIYLRVSTDNQTTDNQRRELAAVAARSGGTLSAFTKMPASPVPRGESSVRNLTSAEGCHRPQDQRDRGLVR
jgi:hypothetical protein